MGSSDVNIRVSGAVQISKGIDTLWVPVYLGVVNNFAVQSIFETSYSNRVLWDILPLECIVAVMASSYIAFVL